MSKLPFMEHVSIAILLIVSVVALGALTAINMAAITGNFQIDQHAPIDTLAGYFVSDSCPERIIYQDQRQTVVDPNPDWCNE